MAIAYHIYRNDGRGGEVDYNSPIATTAGPTFEAGSLAAPGDHRFGVRAFDATSGIEEANTDARVRIVLDPDGNDVTARPNGVVGLQARATAGATCWVAWGYDPTGQGGPPTSFLVAIGVASATGSGFGSATLDYLPGVAGYGCSLAGLPANTPCLVTVRAVGSSSLLAGPIATALVIDPATPLGAVDSLVAAAVP